MYGCMVRLCYVMFCFVVLCYAMLYYVMYVCMSVIPPHGFPKLSTTVHVQRAILFTMNSCVNQWYQIQPQIAHTNQFPPNVRENQSINQSINQSNV